VDRQGQLSHQDVDVSLKVWGKQVPMLKGSTVRRKAPVVREDVVEVPKEIWLLHKRVTLTIVIFLSMVPHTLQLSVCEFVSSIFKALKNMHNYYLQRGF
jgi:hypothetical protein